MHSLRRTAVSATATFVIVASCLLSAVSVSSATPLVRPTVGTPREFVPTAPTITAVTGGLGSGQLLVAYAAPVSDGGSPVTSYDVSIDNGVAWWPCIGTAGTCTLTNLTNGRTYSVSLRALNAAGAGPASIPVSGTPSVPVGFDPDKPKVLPKPRAWVNASFDAAGNIVGVDGIDEKLGVGTLPQLVFTRDVPDKEVVERHLTVRALTADGRSRVVKGAWGWLDDRVVVFRPMRYWPGHATITVTSTLDRAVLGKQSGKFVVGSTDLGATYTFHTARKFIAKVDGATAHMKVYVDGVKVKTFGVSLGKSEWETRSGVKVISTLKEPTHTYKSTSLGLGPEEEYELVAPWNTRLTPTGEFIHTATWAYGRIGRYNGSHGCTNMFESDAKWIYDKTIPGDVVYYVNTGGDPVQPWNGPGGLWNIPWQDWVKKSALGSVTGNPDTSDVTVVTDFKPVGA